MTRLLDFLMLAFARILGPLAALALLAIMAVMVADVSGRFLFSRPIRGAYEITEFLMCVMIGAALPLAGLWGRHIEASLIADTLPRLAPAMRWLAGVASVVVFVWLAIRMWDYGLRLEGQGARSLFGGIPHAPFAYATSIFFALSALGSGLHALRPDTRQTSGDETDV